MSALSQSTSPSSSLTDGRCLLFAYGQLQPGRRQPRTVSRMWPDRVRGELFDLGSYPAAVNVGAMERWFHGYVMEIDESELLAELDPYEGVHEGVYRRVRTTTEAGFEVWIYEYAKPLSSDAVGPIDRWHGPKKTTELPDESAETTNEEA